MASMADAKVGERARPLLCYYGDDFTGSTDVLEALFRHGLHTVLFLAPPTPEQLGRFPDAACIGVAGVGRSMTPDEMERELRPLFRMLKTLGASIFHYKVCSTFDSSPGVGSIGKAAEIGREVFGGRFVPVIAGVPYLRRYTVFGHHFAAAGGQVYRLDRHPTMSRHPVTPMGESDLLRHLAGQTAMRSALFSILDQEGPMEEVSGRLERLAEAERPELVLFDVLDDERLAKVGRLILEEAGRQGTVFVVGSSGVEYALAGRLGGQAHGGGSGAADGGGHGASAADGGGHGASAADGGSAAMTAGGGDRGPVEAAGGHGADEVDRLLVISGSCSPMTERQIAAAVTTGYTAIRVPVSGLIREEERARTMERLTLAAKQALSDGRSVVLYSAAGPGDGAIEAGRAELAARGFRPEDSSRVLGTAMGTLARELVADLGLRRVLVAGGDTSGYVTRELGVYALSCRAELEPGGPLCRAWSSDPRFDGLELVLKGGQVGSPNFFEHVRRGRVK